MKIMEQMFVRFKYLVLRINFILLVSKVLLFVNFLLLVV